MTSGILVGIDDTDMPETPGTNQLARRLAELVRSRYRCRRIVRHQLCGDPRIPCTSKNGSASLELMPLGVHELDWLRDRLRNAMRDAFVPGSDPGLCIAAEVSGEVVAFGQLAQREITTQDVARKLAADAGISLEGLGGTEGGVIGALAAVGLAATGNDGRIVQWGEWPDDLRAIVNVTEILARDVQVQTLHEGQPVTRGTVDLVKKLRPVLREGQAVLSVIRNGDQADWTAVKLL
jgi:tRNA(Ile2) C34 agmatinyltransferase TiaS